MIKVEQKRTISKEGDTSLRTWDPIMFDDLSQTLFEIDDIKISKENETEFNFEYVIRFIMFTIKDWNKMIDLIKALPESKEKTKLINSLQNG